MSSFDEWDKKPRDTSVPMNLYGLREEAYKAGMERAAEIITQLGKGRIYLDAIRKEIEK